MSWQEGLTYGECKEFSIHLVILVTDNTPLEKRIPYITSMLSKRNKVNPNYTNLKCWEEHSIMGERNW